jgi:hypothetical protein
MPNGTKESVMTTIMNLLNLAADENASPHERELAAQRAERLMEKHMIDRMDLKPEEKSKIACDTWELHVNEMGDTYYEYAYNMQMLMEDVLTHCGCRLNYNYTRVDGNTRSFKVVGFPEDLMYAERVWFRTYKEFVMNINPQWLPGRDKLGQNCYNFLKSGVKWEKIWRLAFKYQQDMRETSRGWAYLTASGRTREIPDPYTTKYAPMLKAATKEYCASIGIEYQAHTQRHEAYRTSFARSFSSEIGYRLQRHREEAKQAKGDQTGVDSDRFAIALRDTKEQVDEEFYKLFPEFDPEVRKRQQQAAEEQAVIDFLNMTPEEQAYVIQAEAEKEAKYQKARARARRNYGRVREARNNIDESAWQRGQDAARKVDLSNASEVHRPSTKELR